MSVRGLRVTGNAVERTAILAGGSPTHLGAQCALSAATSSVSFEGAFHIVTVINVDERNRWLKCLCEEREL
jgi:hypothetical protein